MTEPRAQPTLRELRQRRESAADWIRYLSWTAMATAAIGASIMLSILLDDATAWPVMSGYLTVYLAMGLAGWRIGKERHKWNAWALLTVYTMNVLITLVRRPTLFGLGLQMLIGVVYLKGFMATLEYPELTQAIESLAQSSTSSTTNG